MGFDDKTSLGQNETGARAALPIWISFMNQALRNTPVETFRPPQGITLVRVNIETGLPSDRDSAETIMEAFIDGSVPGEKDPREKESPSSGAPVRGRSSEDPPIPLGH